MVRRRARARRLGSASWSFACAFALASLAPWLCADRARAQEAAELTLDWRAEPGCPDRTWAETKLRDRLGRPLSLEAETAPLRVSARLSRSSSGYTLSLTTIRGAVQEGETQGTRTLSDARCVEVAQAAILIIALAVEDQQPKQALPAPEPAPAIVATKQETTSGQKESPAANEARNPGENGPAEEAAGAPMQTASLALRVSGLVDVGFLPRIGVGPEITIAFVRPRGRVEFSGYWLPWRATEPDPDGRVTVMLWALRPSGCLSLWHDQSTVLEGDLCLGLELGQARARGSDLNARKEPNWPFRSGWGALRFAARLSPHWALVLSPGLSIPLGRPRYVSETTGLNTRTELHTPSPVSARLSLGIETRF